MWLHVCVSHSKPHSLAPSFMRVRVCVSHSKPHSPAPSFMCVHVYVLKVNMFLWNCVIACGGLCVIHQLQASLSSTLLYVSVSTKVNVVGSMEVCDCLCIHACFTLQASLFGPLLLVWVCVYWKLMWVFLRRCVTACVCMCFALQASFSRTFLLLCICVYVWTEMQQLPITYMNEMTRDKL